MDWCNSVILEFLVTLLPAYTNSTLPGNSVHVTGSGHGNSAPERFFEGKVSIDNCEVEPVQNTDSGLCSGPRADNNGELAIVAVVNNTDIDLPGEPWKHRSLPHLRWIQWIEHLDGGLNTTIGGHNQFLPAIVIQVASGKVNPGGVVNGKSVKTCKGLHSVVEDFDVRRDTRTRAGGNFILPVAVGVDGCNAHSTKVLTAIRIEIKEVARALAIENADSSGCKTIGCGNDLVGSISIDIAY